MLSERMNDELNKQINAELFSSYLYLSMSGWFESKGLDGFAHWMRLQAKEENFHAEKFFDYVYERGGRVVLDTIEKPENDWQSVHAAFEQALKHEQLVSSLINDLVNVSQDEKDHATTNFLQWFVAEQVEEEATAGGIVDKLALIGNDTAGLFALDIEMAKRAFTPETE